MRLSPSDLLMTKLGSADLENFEIFSIDDLTDTNWRKLIVEYREIQRGRPIEKSNICI